MAAYGGDPHGRRHCRRSVACRRCISSPHTYGSGLWSPQRARDYDVLLAAVLIPLSRSNGATA